MTVTRNRFSSSSCIEPEIEPMAQQRVFKFFQDHSLPFTFREKEVKNVKRFRWQSQIVKLQLSKCHRSTLKNPLRLTKYLRKTAILNDRIYLILKLFRHDSLRVDVV